MSATTPQPPTTWFGKTRDRIAQRLANAAMRLATPYYRGMVGGAIEYGLRANARDVRDGRPAPGPWRPAGDAS